MQDFRESLKQMICEALHLEDVAPSDIRDDDPLFGDGLGLDSVDALELAMEIETRYGIRLRQEEDRKAFASVSTLAAFLEAAGAQPTATPETTTSETAISETGLAAVAPRHDKSNEEP